MNRLLLIFLLPLTALAQTEVFRLDSLNQLSAANPAFYARNGRATIIINDTNYVTPLIADWDPESAATTNQCIYPTPSDVGRWIIRNCTVITGGGGGSTNEIQLQVNGSDVENPNLVDGTGYQLLVTGSDISLDIDFPEAGDTTINVNGTNVVSPILTNGANYTWTLNGTTIGLDIDIGGGDPFALTVNGTNVTTPNLASQVGDGYWAILGTNIYYNLDYPAIIEMVQDNLGGGFLTTATPGDLQFFYDDANNFLQIDYIGSGGGGTNLNQLLVKGVVVNNANLEDDGGDVDPNIASATNVTFTIKTNSVGTSKIVDAAITSSKVADGNILTNKLQTITSVTSGVYSNATVTVNDKGLVVAIAAGSGGEGGPTILYIDGNPVSPYFTNGVGNVTANTNANGHIYFTASGDSAAAIDVNGSTVNDPNLVNTDYILLSAAGSNISITPTNLAKLDAPNSFTESNSFTDVEVAAAAVSNAVFLTGLPNRLAVFGASSNLLASAAIADPLNYNTSTRALSLSNSTVTPGSYTSADITVDQYGRVTAAANGSGGGGSSAVTNAITDAISVWGSVKFMTDNDGDITGVTTDGEVTGATYVSGDGATTPLMFDLEFTDIGHTNYVILMKNLATQFTHTLSIVDGFQESDEARIMIAANGANFAQDGDQFDIWVVTKGQVNVTKVPSNRRSPPPIESEFFIQHTGSANFGPYLGAGVAIASGTIALTQTGMTNPHTFGLVAISSSGSANSGYSLQSNNSGIIVGGNEEMEFVFRVENAANTVGRMGLISQVTAAAMPHSVMFDIQGLTLQGTVSSNSVVTSTASTYTISTNTWYSGTIAVNSTGSSATFTLYNDTGTQLWQASAAGTLPIVGGGRYTGFGVNWYNTVGGSLPLVILDYMRFDPRPNLDYVR